tara:strand:- start:2215 stop:2424 length:210 start_codon:yes stop_codon:yes gene_type:complete
MNLTIENVELWLAALAAIAGLGVWGYKKWLSIKEGGISLGEVLDAVEEAADKVEEVKEQVEEAIEETKE